MCLEIEDAVYSGLKPLDNYYPRYQAAALKSKTRFIAD
jgi:hypothetical protein